MVNRSPVTMRAQPFRLGKCALSGSSHQHLSASAGIDGVRFMAHHCHSPAIVQTERPGAGRGENVSSGGQHMQHTMQRDAGLMAALVTYNPKLPIETFDFSIVDECHRSIYNIWRQVLEYFDAFIMGLTATPSKQTIGFFRNNLVMEYGHDQPVADNINVGFIVYRIRTKITEQGATLEW